MKQIIIILCLLLVLAACKNSNKEVDLANDANEKIENEAEQANLTNTLRIYIDGIIKNDVHPKIIFTDDFATDEVFANSIIGRPKMKQRLSFILPESSLPHFFSIVFDTDCVIDLERIVLNVNDDRIIIKDSAFYEYFNFSKSLRTEKNILYINKSDTLKSSLSLNERIKNRYSKYNSYKDH